MILRIWARLGDREPPSLRDGALAARLAAWTAHAASCRWVPVSATFDVEAWRRGAGPGGLRIGVVAEEGSRIFAAHPAPGEIAATIGPGPTDLARFLAFLGAGRRGRARLDVHGEHFLAAPAGEEAVSVRQIAPDGEVEDVCLIPQRALDDLRRERPAVQALFSRIGVEDPDEPWAAL